MTSRRGNWHGLSTVTRRASRLSPGVTSTVSALEAATRPFSTTTRAASTQCSRHSSGTHKKSVVSSGRLMGRCSPQAAMRTCFVFGMLGATSGLQLTATLALAVVVAGVETSSSARPRSNLRVIWPRSRRWHGVLFSGICWHRYLTLAIIL